jgi:hypothetical protein
MDADETQERLLRRRLLLLRFATETQDESARMTKDFDPDTPVGRALEEIEANCRQLIQMLESSAGRPQPETSRED